MANISSRIEGIISPSSTTDETVITLPFSTSDNVFFKDGKTLQSKYDNGELGGGSSSQSKWYGKNIISFGDSITTLYPSIACGILGAYSTNKGSSGGTYARDWTILQNIGSNIENYDAVTLMTGHNRGPGELTLTTSGLSDVTDVTNYDSYPDNYYGGIGKMIEYIRANSNAKIYLLTLHETRINGYNNSKQCRKALFELGEYYASPVVDVYANCGINKTNLSKYSTDLLHLDETGQRMLGECIAYQMMYL